MIKLADTLEPMADFPSAYAKDIAFNDGDTLQEKLDTGSLGGGGVGYKQLSQAEYDALTDDEKMDGREYRTYDTGHIYKLGIEYGKDGVQIDDTTASETSVWSSKKTSDEITKVETELKCVENKKPDAKTVSFELNSASWNCGTIYGNTNNGGNFKYDYYVTYLGNNIELVKQDVYGPQGSITASLSGTTLTLTASGDTTIKTVTIIKS